jgi:hypothetical protein
MVAYWGMPHLFLTLTADEMSPLKWTEIEQVNQFLQGSFNEKFDWRNAPVECCRLFHNRFQAFFRRHIISKKGGLLGRVLHWVVRYEVQARGSLHVHVLLWLHADDVDRVTNEICACIPGTVDEASNTP